MTNTITNKEEKNFNIFLHKDNLIEKKDDILKLIPKYISSSYSFFNDDLYYIQDIISLLKTSLTNKTQEAYSLHTQIKSFKKNFYSFDFKKFEAGKNKEDIFNKLKKYVFNSENFLSLFKENSNIILFYNGNELTIEQKNLAFEHLLKNNFSFLNALLIDDSYYYNNSNFFQYCIQNKHDELFINTIKKYHKKNDDTIFNILIETINNLGFSSYLMKNFLDLMKKEKIFNEIFDTYEKQKKLCFTLPSSALLLDKRTINKFKKEYELILLLAQKETHFLSRLFEDKDVHFIQDTSIISNIIKYNLEFISTTPLWNNLQDIFEALQVHNSCSNQRLEEISLKQPNIKTKEFINLFFLPENLKNSSKNINLIEKPIFFDIIKKDKQLFKSYCNSKNLVLTNNSTTSYTSYNYSKYNNINTNQSTKYVIDFPVDFLSDIDYCISLEKENLSFLKINEIFMDKLIYSRKYALHHLTSIAKKPYDDLFYIKSKIHPKMYEFFLKVGVEKNLITFLETYFNKLEVKNLIEKKEPTIIDINSINEIVDLNVNVKQPIKINTNPNIKEKKVQKL